MKNILYNTSYCTYILSTTNYFRGKPFRRRAKYNNEDSLDDVNLDDDNDDDEVSIHSQNSQNGTRHSRKFCDTSGGV